MLQAHSLEILFSSPPRSKLPLAALPAASTHAQRETCSSPKVGSHRRFSASWKRASARLSGEGLGPGDMLPERHRHSLKHLASPGSGSFFLRGVEGLAFSCRSLGARNCNRGRVVVPQTATLRVGLFCPIPAASSNRTLEVEKAGRSSPS